MRLCTHWRRCWQAVVLPALIQAASLSWVICCIAQVVTICQLSVLGFTHCITATAACVGSGQNPATAHCPLYAQLILKWQEQHNSVTGCRLKP